MACSICGKCTVDSICSACIDGYEPDPDDEFDPQLTRRKPLRLSKVGYLVRCHLARAGAAGSGELARWISSGNKKGIVRYAVPWTTVREWCLSHPEVVCLKDGKWTLV